MEWDKVTREDENGEDQNWEQCKLDWMTNFLSKARFYVIFIQTYIKSMIEVIGRYYQEGKQEDDWVADVVGVEDGVF